MKIESDCPCRHCTSRNETCHAACLDYAEFKSANMKNWKDCIFQLYEYDAPNAWMFVLKNYQCIPFKNAVNEYIFGGKKQ